MTIDRWRNTMLPPMTRPVPAANLHLTLVFLGEVKPQQREALEQQAGVLIIPPFDLHIDQQGYFAGPDILWLGPSVIPTPLHTLVDGLTSSARRVGIQADSQAFVPHITLARRCPTPPPAGLMAPDFHLSFEEFALFESVQGRRGVRYLPRAIWRLG